ncbi:MAG: hypothetical protein R2854_29800 [Caldilineaceae bacterium]
MTLTTAIQTYLTGAATSEFRGLEVTVVDHWEGRDNLLWRVEAGAQNAAQDAVIKLFLDAGQVRSRRQYDGQQLFAPVGIAPQPLWYDRYPDGLSPPDHGLSLGAGRDAKRSRQRRSVIRAGRSRGRVARRRPDRGAPLQPQSGEPGLSLAAVGG